MSSLTAANVQEDLGESWAAESVEVHESPLAGRSIQTGSKPWLTAISRSLLIASATALAVPTSVASPQESVIVHIEAEGRRGNRRLLSPREAWELAQAARIRAEEAEKAYWAEEARRMNLWEDEDDL